jgi:hypothetical protein
MGKSFSTDRPCSKRVKTEPQGQDQGRMEGVVVTAGARGAYRWLPSADAPASVPHRVVFWCLHCGTVNRLLDKPSQTCPECGAGYHDLWRYYDLPNGMPPSHWPSEAPADGSFLDLYGFKS